MGTEKKGKKKGCKKEKETFQMRRKIDIAKRQEFNKLKRRNSREKNLKNIIHLNE